MKKVGRKEICSIGKKGHKKKRCCGRGGGKGLKVLETKGRWGRREEERFEFSYNQPLPSLRPFVARFPASPRLQVLQCTGCTKLLPDHLFHMYMYVIYVGQGYKTSLK